MRVRTVPTIDFYENVHTKSRRASFDSLRVVRVLILFLLAAVSCTSRTDGTTAVLLGGTSVSSLSVTVQPSSLSLSPGGSAVAIGTIRGAPASVESTVVGLPNGVSARVTSATVSDSVTTKKYIFTADANVPPGTYGLTIRVTAVGRPATEVPLTLVVAMVGSRAGSPTA